MGVVAPAALGRYVVYDEIASGGMATVHLGRLIGPAGFSRTVAIKRLHPQFAKDPDFVTMFLDEARLAARVRHPNVASTLDVIASPAEVLLVMDYVHGESLSKLARAVQDRGERIPLPIACTIMDGVLAGLHAAHEATTDGGEPLGIVHRDVSPQNVLVGVDGIPRLLDFGVAKAAMRHGSTREGELKGKLAYMAPEQVRLQPIDRRSDLFSATIVFWELITGERLFHTPEPAATVARIVGEPVLAPSKVAPDLPAALDAVVLRGLERDVAARFLTALEMRRALEAVGPMASARAVGEWVEATASSALGARARRVAEVERDTEGKSGVALGATAPAAGGPPEVPTEVSVSLAVDPAAQSSPSGEKRGPARRGVLGIAVAVAGATAVAAIALVVGRHAIAPAAPAAPPSVASMPGTSPSASTSASPSAPASAPDPTAATDPSSAPPAPARPARVPVRPPPGPNCQPAFTIDDRGIKHFKPECLRR